MSRLCGGSSEDGGGAVGLNFSESGAYSGGEGAEAASEKRACQDPGARQYSSSL